MENIEAKTVHSVESKHYRASGPIGVSDIEVDKEARMGYITGQIIVMTTGYDN